MVKDILLMAAGVFLTFTAAAWGFVFYETIRTGSFVVYEPDPAILTAEFSLAIVLTCLGLAAFIMPIIKK